MRAAAGRTALISYRQGPGPNAAADIGLTVLTQHNEATCIGRATNVVMLKGYGLIAAPQIVH